MTAQDQKLAEKLFLRANKFIAQNNYSDAILDLASGYRLMEINNNPDISKFYDLWQKCYNKLTAVNSPKNSNLDIKVAKLQNMLQKSKSL